MDYYTIDLMDRLDMLENEVYQLQKKYKQNPLMNLHKIKINKSFGLASANNLALGNLSTSKEIELLIMCKIVCSIDVLVSLYIDNVLLDSSNIIANNTGMLCILRGITTKSGKLMIKINKDSLSGTLCDLSIIFDDKATFLEEVA